MTQEAQIKACPFCGSEATLFVPEKGHGLPFVGCVHCSCEVGAKGLTEAQAAERWNTRIESGVVAELKALALQYRDDLKYPPARDSMERRVEHINAILAKLEASK